MITNIRFRVTEPTGKPIDLSKVWRHEEWAAGWCKPKGSFFVDEDGLLGFEDACGETSYPPEGRFAVELTTMPNPNF